MHRLNRQLEYLFFQNILLNLQALVLLLVKDHRLFSCDKDRSICLSLNQNPLVIHPLEQCTKHYYRKILTILILGSRRSFIP